MKKWQLQSKTLVENQEQLIRVLLSNRQIKKKETQEFFKPLHPTHWQLTDLKISRQQFNKIHQRLLLAKKKQEKVYIFGDYDCDGICASAVLWEGLKLLDIKSLPFIPNRQKHGYGLSVAALKDLFADQGKPDLLITVDNGIVALPALKFLAKVGVEVIVTDHHQAYDKHLPVLAVFHSTQVCGAAVAWFLVKELFAHDINQHNQKQVAKKLEDLLSLVAIATVTDLMKLRGINRSLVSHGLTALQKTARPGLLALYQVASIKKEEITSYHLGYVIGPRINAMGRLADSMDALRLLCTQNSKQATQLAGLLQDTNVERQDLTNDLLEQAENSLSQQDKQAKLIIVEGDYHEGVIGLLAGQLVEKYLKPSLVISVPQQIKDKKLLIKASARSLAGFNITDFLRQVKDQLVSVGGHPLAAGFSLRFENLSSVKKRLSSLAKKQLAGVVLTPEIKIDCPISTDLLNLDTALALESFEPYGNGNSQAIFLLSNLVLQNLQMIGKKELHAKLFFQKPKQQQELVVLAWRCENEHGLPKLAQHYDILVKLSVNRWHNNSQVQITLQAIRKSEL